MNHWLRRDPGGLTLALHVQPRASRDAVAGVHDGCLRLRITAPPVGGAANEHLLRFVARLFSVPPARVSLLRGAAGRRKLVRVAGVARLPDALATLTDDD